MEAGKQMIPSREVIHYEEDNGVPWVAKEGCGDVV